MICGALAETCWRSGKLPEAAQYQQQACDVRAAMLKAAPSSVGSSILAADLANLAARYDVAKQTQLVRAPLEQAARVYEQLLAESLRESPDVRNLRIELARAYCDLHELATAQPEPLEAAAVKESLVWLRRARQLIEPVLQANPDDKDAKEILDTCQQGQRRLSEQAPQSKAKP